MAREDYFNYNLSLVNPDDIKIDTPLPEKDESYDLSAYVLNEQKASPEEDISEVSLGNEGASIFLAREWPLDTIEDEFLTARLREATWNYKAPSLISSDQALSMDEFRITPENKGKSIGDESWIEEIDPTFQGRILDQEYEKTKSGSDVPAQYDSKYVSEKTSKQEYGPFDEIDPNFEVRTLDQDYEKSKSSGNVPSVYETSTVSEGSGKPEDGDYQEIENDISVKVLDQEYEKNKASGNEPSRYDEQDVTGVDSSKDDTIDIMNLNPFITGKIAKDPYTNNEISYDDVISKLNKKEQPSNLGALHVYPVNPSDEGGISSKYTIPFEFNPKITESGRAAKYEISSLTSRVGDIHSYIKTDSSNVQLITSYQVLSIDKSKNPVPTNTTGDHNMVGSWMDDFHMRNVQSIEMAYRGLVFPQSSKEAGSFFRPPIIKIVFGNSQKINDGQTVDESVPFNNLLTYPYKMATSTKIYHKSFIVLKVDIKKNWENTPVVLNDNEDGILDLQGFDVTLDLVEVDPMYIGVLPTFEDYYSIVPAI